MDKDIGLEVLLSLDGEIFAMENGCWTKIEVKLVTKTEWIPHGIRYSLTLHNRHNQRILGFDNAHGIKPKRKKYGAKKITWDHKHHRELTTPYEFESAAQLMEDFWYTVELILNEEKE